MSEIMNKANKTIEELLLQELIEALHDPRTTVNGLARDACVAIFRGDRHWWTTVTAGVDRRFVRVSITTGADGTCHIAAKKSKTLQPGCLEVDIAAVQALGRWQSGISLEEILASHGLTVSLLFAVDGNKDPFVCFARDWWRTLTHERQMTAMLEPLPVKAARVHIAWLDANCPNRQLTDASSFDQVTKTCGDHHPFPTQADLDVVGDDKPAYVSAYLALWNPKPPIELSGPMTTDLAKFDVFVNFLRDHPDTVFQ